MSRALGRAMGGGGWGVRTSKLRTSGLESRFSMQRIEIVLVQYMAFIVVVVCFLAVFFSWAC